MARYPAYPSIDRSDEKGDGGVSGEGVSRRDLMRFGLFGTLSAPTVAGLLAACGGDSPRRTVSPTSLGSSSTVPPSTVALDPGTPWWLQRGFAPVADEVETFALEVIGAIPPELAGLYARNGSNPATGSSSHWFFGDGMLHGVHLEGGKAKWYRNRYIETPFYEQRVGFGEGGAPGGGGNQSNVSAVWHGGRLLTSGEVGFPYEIDATDLSTVGVYDFGGKLASSFTAHPKIDPQTGVMHTFGYGFTQPYLTYNVIDRDGRLIHSEPVAVNGPTMIHDFAITDRDVVFWELPVVFDLESAIRWIESGSSDDMPFQWRPSYGARVGVMPLGGPASQIVWHELDPCYAFHGVNAYRDDTDNVVLDICRMSSMFKKGEAFGGASSLRRWTMDGRGGAVRDEIMVEEGASPGELPIRDPRVVGRRHRYAYFVQTRDDVRDTVDLGGLVKHDYDTGAREVWDPGPAVHSGEWLFVPADNGTEQDAGWLLAYVTDEATNKSDLSIIDATAVEQGPIARVELPQRVPDGFHGTWVPA